MDETTLRSELEVWSQYDPAIARLALSKMQLDLIDFQREAIEINDDEIAVLTSGLLSKTVDAQDALDELAALWDEKIGSRMGTALDSVHIVMKEED